MRAVSILVRSLLTLVVMALVVQQGLLFVATALNGGLIYNAGIGAVFVLLWPVAVAVVAVVAVYFIWITRL